MFMSKKGIPKYPGPKTTWVDRCRSYDVVKDSSSQAAFDRAAEWLSHCVKHDKSCIPPVNNFAPRRLLNVIPGNPKGDPFLFDATEPLTYACLSYCWGDDTDDVLQTTTSNLEAHYEAIPLQSMPKSVQDAVTVCRGLKIPYLWVDSLCIVQDDHDAWLRDASKMDRIYLNSHVTIAALEPSSCKTGFLGRQQFGRPGWQLQSVLPGTSQEIVIRPGMSRSAGSSSSSSSSSLDRRGWCLQETLLPFRRLCFGGDEMSWECSCRRACECGHQVWPTESGAGYGLSFGRLGAFLREASLPVTPAPKTNICGLSTEGRILRWLQGPSGHLMHKRHNGSPHRIYELWRRVVTEFSRRSLSRPSDKLTALAGLANMIGDHDRRVDKTGGHGYLAGLWKRELPFELAWLVVDFKPRPAVQLNKAADLEEKRIFPSWSWASCDEVINYDFVDPILQWKYTPKAGGQCILRDAQGTLGKQTCNGEAGRISLEGAFVPVKLAVLAQHVPSTNGLFEHVTTAAGEPRSETAAFVRTRSLRAVSVSLDRLTAPTMREDDDRAACWVNGQCKEHCCSWGSDEGGGGDEQGGRYYCFRLFSWVGQKGYRDCDFDGKRRRRTMGPDTWFLLLRPSVRVRGAFERVGAGVASDWFYSEDRRCPLFDAAETKVIDVV